jgi:hypothetical protein
MLKNKENEQYAKWLAYWMSKVPQTQNAVEDLPSKKTMTHPKSPPAKQVESSVLQEPRRRGKRDRGASANRQT